MGFLELYFKYKLIVELSALGIGIVAFIIWIVWMVKK
jgi:hypothetical protein